MEQTKYVMKNLGLLFCLLLFQNIVLSQEIVVPDKSWEGLYNGNPNNSFQSKFRSTSKSIGGIDYFELMFKVDDGWFEGVKRYYRQDGDRVYYLQEGEDKLILDFGLSVGDTIEISDDSGDRYMFFPVRTTDTLIFNKQLRKLEMRVKPEGEPVSQVPHVWIEGVGDTGFFFGNGYVFGNQDASPIFCVRDEVPFFSAGMECPGLFTSASAIEVEDVSGIFYNQSIKMIEITNKLVDRLDLYSLTGERFGSYFISADNNSVDVSSIVHSWFVAVIFDGAEYQSEILKL